MQEAALPADSTCFYGSLEIPLLDILRTAIWLWYCRYHIPFEPEHYIGLKNARWIWGYADSDFGPYKPGHRWALELFNSLVDLGDLDVFDQRDHVNAILGLYQKFRTGERLPEILAPDYSKPLREVLRDATRFGIGEAKDLYHLNNIAHRCPSSINHAEVPTWVLRADQDWNGDQDPCQLRYLFQSCGPHRAFRTSSASIGTSEEMSEDADLLIAYGIYVDNLSCIFQVITRENSVQTDVKVLDTLKPLSSTLVARSSVQALLARPWSQELLSKAST